MASSPKAIARNRQFIRELRKVTFCALCGKQPIDWHGEHHNEGGHKSRPSAMVNLGVSIANIKAEIARCTPLCRRCHMTVDGRIRFCGEQKSCSKLTAKEVKQIRALRTKGVLLKVIAARFGIDLSYVAKIARRETWKHLV